jgi:hypothetical protein
MMCDMYTIAGVTGHTGKVVAETLERKGSRYERSFEKLGIGTAAASRGKERRTGSAVRSA